MKVNREADADVDGAPMREALEQLSVEASSAVYRF